MDSDRDSLHSPLPLELEELVIDSSCDSVSTLRSCSLTCRRWLPRSRYHLFSSIRVSTKDELYALHQAIEDAPHLELPARVQSITIKPQVDVEASQHLADIVPVPLLTRLPRLRRWVIHGPPLQETEEPEGEEECQVQDVKKHAPLLLWSAPTLKYMRMHAGLVQELCLGPRVAFPTPKDCAMLVSSFPAIRNLRCIDASFHKLDDMHGDSIYRAFGRTPYTHLTCLSMEGVAVEAINLFLKALCPQLVNLVIDVTSANEATLDLLSNAKAIQDLTLSIRLAYQLPPEKLTGFFGKAMGRATDIIDRLERGDPLKDLTVRLSYREFHEISTLVVYTDGVEEACSRFEQSVLQTSLSQVMFTVCGGIRRRDAFWRHALEKLFPELYSGNKLKLVSIPDDEVDPGYGHDTQLTALAVSPNNQWIASGAEDATIILWKITDDTIEVARDWRAQMSDIEHLQFAPDSLRLSSNGWHGRVKVWDIVHGTRLASWPVHSILVPPLSTVWSPDGRIAAYYSGDSGVSLCDAQTYEICVDIDLSTGFREPTCSVFSSDGSYVATGDYSVVHMHECSTLDELEPLRRAGFKIPTTATFTLDGTQLIVVWPRSCITFWDYRSIQQPNASRDVYLVSGQSEPLQESIVTALSLGGTTLLWVPRDANHVDIFDTESGTLSVSLVHDEHHFVLTACFSPCGGYVATAGEDRYVRLWEKSSGTCLAAFECGRGAPTHIAFTPDGRRLIAGTGVGSVYVHRVGDLIQRKVV